jgi:hypothetical protein
MQPLDPHGSLAESESELPASDAPSASRMVASFDTAASDASRNILAPESGTQAPPP